MLYLEGCLRERRRSRAGGSRLGRKLRMMGMRNRLCISGLGELVMRNNLNSN